MGPLLIFEAIILSIKSNLKVKFHQLQSNPLKDEYNQIGIDYLVSML